MNNATYYSRKLVLASSSSYRKALLQRLGLDFECFSPNIDETQKPAETPEQLVYRLSLYKARAAAKHFPDALVIGSDQIAVLNDRILGKPGSSEEAKRQLIDAAGKTLNFLTGLCLFNTKSEEYQLDIVPFSVTFRQLSSQQIGDYVERDNPTDCAGSFKWECLGISLFREMNGEDITALEGLPLIRLIDMLEQEGLYVLGSRRP